MKQYPLKTTVLDSAVNEVYLFHGTTKSVADIIVNKGFETRQASEIVKNQPNNGMFGTGIYFSENSSKSNQYVACPICSGNAIGQTRKHPCTDTAEKIEKAGGYVMIIARVLLGDSHICKTYNESDYKGKDKPPKKPDSDKYYDSIFAECKKNVPSAHHLNYREFIVYEDSQIYPEFLVYYSRLPQVPK